MTQCCIVYETPCADCHFWHVRNAFLLRAAEWCRCRRFLIVRHITELLVDHENTAAIMIVKNVESYASMLSDMQVFAQMDAFPAHVLQRIHILHHPYHSVTRVVKQRTENSSFICVWAGTCCTCQSTSNDCLAYLLTCRLWWWRACTTIRLETRSFGTIEDVCAQSA
jgi:hypothetical protein